MAKAGYSKPGVEARKKAFVEAYLVNGGNAREAARTAGYSGTEANLAVHGSRLLKDPWVAAELARRQKAIAKKLELNTENVLRNLAQAIHFDPRRLYREDGSLKAVHELDDDTAAALSGFEISEIGTEGVVIGHTKKVKWLDKNAAREQAMKHLGLYEKDNRQSRPVIVFKTEDAGVL